MKSLVKSALASLLALVILLATPVFVRAHGSSFNFKFIDGSNVIMITHNVHDPQAGVPLTYNIRLYNLTGQAIPFDQLETEFKRDGQSVYKQAFGPSHNDDVTLTYTYPKEGNYMLYTRFLDKGTQIVQGEFPLVVQKGLQTNFASFFTLQTTLAFLVGATAATVFWQYRRIAATPSKPVSKSKSTSRPGRTSTHKK